MSLGQAVKTPVEKRRHDRDGARPSAPAFDDVGDSKELAENGR